MDITAAIEKNRTALLRLVIGWLMVAALFGPKRDRVLPRRIGLWVSSMIFKAEKAAYFLRVATVRNCRTNLRAIKHVEPVWSAEPLTTGAAIARLKALKKALINLRDYARRFASDGGPVQTACIGIAPNFAFVLPKSLGRHSPAIACRAPPEKFNSF